MQPETRERTPLSEIERRISSAVGSPVSITPGGETVMEAPFVAWTGCVWGKAALPVGYYVNSTNPVPGNGGPSGAAFVTLVQQSHQAWEDLPDSVIDFTYLGTTTRSGPDPVNDGNNDVRYADLDGYGTGVVGINACFSVGGFRVDSDTRLDSTRPDPGLWDPDDSNGIGADRYSLQSVTEHELGHALGLDHTNVTCDGTAATPLMCPSLANGQRKTIKADDRAGAAALYPASPSVGGIAELPEAAESPVEGAGSLRNESDSAAGTYAALAGGIAAAVVALGAGAWYARRRLSRS